MGSQEHGVLRIPPLTDEVRGNLIPLLSLSDVTHLEGAGNKLSEKIQKKGCPCGWKDSDVQGPVEEPGNWSASMMTPLLSKGRRVPFE
jgi:hypothetical protein